MKYLPAVLILSVGASQASNLIRARENDTSGAWDLEKFKNHILFGDSYSDENRFAYFAAHNGSAPPTGTLFPEQTVAATGGRVWARFVTQYTDNELSLYNYAVDGGACSNRIVPRIVNASNSSLDFIYPDIESYELPAFLADKEQDVNIDTGGPYFTPALNEDNSVYTIWDGVNDIAIASFFTNSQRPGYVLSDFVDCLYTQMDRIYASGGRYIVLFNLIPLELTPLFANASEGGMSPDYFWNEKPSNLTDISEKAREWTTTLNTVFEYRTPVEVLLNDRYPGAKVALFDVYSLFLDIHGNPSAYLNGTQPLTVTDYEHHCNLQAQDCTLPPNPDSYMWYDLSHPSEQTSRIIGQKFKDLLGGSSEYATYYQCS